MMGIESNFWLVGSWDHGSKLFELEESPFLSEV